MKDFLSLVLPSEGSGNYIAWDGRSKAHSAHATLEGLVAALQAIDARGGEAYYATATFSGADRLTAEVAAKRALYLDIDFKNVPEEDPLVAVIRQLKAFTKAYQLPAPTYIMSTGGGIHVYWALDADTDPTTWKLYADALKVATKAAGIPADHAITGDLARVLRPLGSHNRKYDPPYLTEGRLTGKAHALAAFDTLLTSGAPPSTNTAFAGLELPQGSAESRYRPFWIKSIVESNECRLVHWALKPENQTRSSMNEALWADLLAMCSKAEDGVFYAHEFSRHDSERYADGAAVDAKLAAWKGNQHPRTCAHMAGHGKCGGCPHAVSNSTPIRHGYLPPAEVAPGSTDPSKLIAALLQTQLRVFYPEEDQEFLDRYRPMVRWPYGFGFDPTTFRTLYFEMVEDQDEEGNRIQRRVTKPLWAGVFWPQHKMRDSRGVMVYEFVFWARRDEHPVRVIIDPSLYGADQPIINLLVRYGFPLAANFRKLATTYFARCLDLINELTRDSLMSECLGWDESRRHFNFGHAYASTEEGTPVLHPCLVSPKITSYGLRMSVAGTLERWREAVATYEGEGRECYQFGLAAGFASALIPFTAQRWSHLIHVFSDASGSGKTSLQQAIWSIWGEPVIDKGRSTYNAMMDRFSVYGCLPGIIDEITLLDSDTLRRLALDVAAGEPRARLLQSGQRVVHGKSWELIGVSSANVDIEYEIRRTGNAEGEMARITSIEIPAGRLDYAKHDVFQQIQTNYGHAGRAFILAVMAHGAPAIRDAIAAVERDLVRRVSPTEAARSALRFKFATFACIIVANRVATECGLTNFKESALVDVAMRLLRAAKSMVADPTSQIIEDVSTFIATNNSFLPRLLRDERGSLSLANRMDGVLSRSLSRIGNAPAATRTDAFIVINDWPNHGVPTIGVGTRPALYVSRAQLVSGRRRLFPSVRTDPLKTVPMRLQGSGYSLDVVTEMVLGVRTEFVRVVMPADAVDAVAADTGTSVARAAPANEREA
jgi:hypothetical protein